MHPAPSPERDEILVVASETARLRSLAASLRRMGLRVSTTREAPAAVPGCPVLLSCGSEASLDSIDRVAAALGGEQPLIVVDLQAEWLGAAIERGADEVVARGAGAAELAARIRCATDRYGSQSRSQLSRGELEALLQITEAATSHLELEELLRVVVARIAEVVPSDRCSAILLDDADYATVMASHDVPHLRRLRIEVDRYPEVRAAVQSLAPVVIDDLHTHPLMENVRPLVSTLPVSSLVVAPLVAQGDAYGALFLRLARNRAFGEHEKAFVRAAASAVANSVRNAKLHTSVRQKRDELEAAYHQRYEELAGLNEQLREINRLKDDLLAMCSHDLRAPLNTLLGHARLLLGAELPAAQLRSVQAVERQGLRLLQLVQQILERGRHRAVTREIEPVDLAAIARALADDAVGERGIRVRAVGDAAVTAEVDASALRQVLENLVANAIAHSPEGAEVEIDVRLAGAADQVRIEVLDRGPGIPEDELPLVFERYRKSGESRGLGLGLAICREIVEQHGGSIWAAAREGGGTRFVFTLPLRREGREGLRLLGICADPDLGDQLVRSVEGRGALVVARSLREGLQQAALLLPEAIFVEAGIDGAAAALRSEAGLGEVPLLFLGEAPDDSFRSLELPLDPAAVRAALGAFPANEA